MKYYLEILVFITGAIVMIFELVGSRIMAPDFGTSMIVWTNLIGVILASLSLGYYLGGKMSDNEPSNKKLSIIVFLSAIGILAPFLLKDLVSRQLLSLVSDLRIGGLMASVFLFAPGSLFLGAVNPYATRLRLKKIESGGKVVGKMSALSTMGSIIGTFLAGIYLVPNFGSMNVVWFIVAILIIISIIIGGRELKKIKVIIFFFLLVNLIFEPFVFNNKYLLAHVETVYNSITVEEGRLSIKNQGPVRTLATDPYGIHGACLVNDCGRLMFETLQFFGLGKVLYPEANNTLMIGGGTYSFPKDFAEKFPNSHMDIVEIDPGFTKLAKEYFDFKEKANLSIYHQDGRIFLNNSESNKYDIIYMDAFNSKVSIPFHLSTIEAVELIHQSLNDSGLTVVNIIGSLSGENSQFLKAEYATYKELFNFVYLFPIQFKSESKVQNIMLVASKKELDFNSRTEEAKVMLSHLYTGEIGEGILLTDNYAPVEFMNLGLAKGI